MSEKCSSQEPTYHMIHLHNIVEMANRIVVARGMCGGGVVAAVTMKE